jgi:uncharacterized membrane protein
MAVSDWSSELEKYWVYSASNVLTSAAAQSAGHYTQVVASVHLGSLQAIENLEWFAILVTVCMCESDVVMVSLTQP